jgi:hypothetical protein
MAGVRWGDRPRRRHRRAVPGGDLVQLNKPGRNDPCWCGSGKKYKRCHLDEDIDDRRRADASARHPP